MVANVFVCGCKRIVNPSNDEIERGFMNVTIENHRIDGLQRDCNVSNSGDSDADFPEGIATGQSSV